MQRLLPILIFLISATAVSYGADLTVQGNRNHQVELKQLPGGIIDIKTTGDDPQVVFLPRPGSTISPEKTVLAFEYFCPDGVDDLEVFYSRSLQQGWSPDRMIQGGSMPIAEAWQPFSVNMAAGSLDHWTPQFPAVRLDFGRSPGLSLQIRNVHFRSPTLAELAGEEALLAKRKAKETKAAQIDSDLARQFSLAQIDRVTVTDTAVIIRGSVSETIAQPVFLVGYEPHENSWEPGHGTIIRSFSAAPDFEIRLPRISDQRDLIAHRWRIVQNGNTGEALTPAVWATEFRGVAARDMPRLRPANRKGLGGITMKKGIFDDDLRDLGITAGTVNMDISGLFARTRETISYVHQGKTWRFAAGPVREWDQVIRELTDREIVVSGILLIAKNQPDLLHPEFERAGIYSMPNLTNREASDAYRAVISFLTKRYSRPDQEHGWITHWIVFNEVDYGWVWTNMGEQPMSVYMDAYDKAMRLTWLEAIQFNPTAEVFISLTHNWDYEPRDPFRSYPPRHQLDRLARYSGVSGDFHWGVAYHPYPQSLLRPRTWEDSIPTASFDTRYITIKNIEVLDTYLRQEQFLYQGSPRTVLLSEQGYHTPDYSAQSMADKAAAIAYTWQKITPLETIETYHYHRWVDHPLEGGLQVGLRTLPREGEPYGERKEPAFSVFGALETENEAAKISPLKAVIGIANWEEVRIPESEIKR
jgi:hypothetical protein